MKKVAITALYAILPIIFLCSCQKNTDPVVQELAPTLQVTTTPQGVLPYGSNVTISWTTTNATKLKIDDLYQTQVVSGSITFEKVCSNVHYTVKATNVSLSTQKEIEVLVGDWTTSKFGLTSYYPWKRSVVRYTRDGVVLSSHDDSNTDIFYYHKNGDLITNFLTFIEKWSISEDGNFMTRGGTTKRFSVTKTDLIFYQETTYNDLPALFENVYVHASDIPTDKK